MKRNAIYHLEFRSGSHHYFGSISAIFDLFDSSTLKVSKSYLWNYGIDECKPYQNKICIIRKGFIQRKKQKKVC